MSAVLLDTSAYSAMRSGNKLIEAAINRASLVVASPVMVAELMFGFIRGRRSDENTAMLDDFLNHPNVLFIEIDLDTGDRYALIAKTLREQGTPIPSNDIWQAALAWQHGYKVLTLDSHFAKIPQVALAL
jgi:tRNA(fMet)-specific endonuclease VapC